MYTQVLPGSNHVGISYGLNDLVVLHAACGSGVLAVEEELVALVTHQLRLDIFVDLRQHFERLRLVTGRPTRARPTPLVCRNTTTITGILL